MGLCGGAGGAAIKKAKEGKGKDENVLGVWVIKNKGAELVISATWSIG